MTNRVDQTCVRLFAGHKKTNPNELVFLYKYWSA